MARPRLRVRDVFREYWQEYERTQKVSPAQRKVVRHIMACRTKELGGHLYDCKECGREVPVYNSCRDRNCPTCQTMAKQKWIEKRNAELLPVRYFHVVFTLPHMLNALILYNRKVLFGLLFSSVNKVLQLFAADPQWRLKGKLGFVGVLHTWSQLLMAHFHLHCIVPGGVWRDDEERWVHSRKKFLFRDTSVAMAFRRIFIEGLVKLREKGQLQYGGEVERLADEKEWGCLISKLKSIEWIVYLKASTRKPEKILDYLARYVKRVAIGDYRIKKIENGQVTFSYRNWNKDNKQDTSRIPCGEFIRRFLLHVLPKDLHKTRFFGFLAHNVKKDYLEKIRSYLKADPPAPLPEESLHEQILRLTGVDIRCCPYCKKPALRYVGILLPTKLAAPELRARSP